MIPENENKETNTAETCKNSKKRNKIARKACAHCQKSHRKCNDMRPCQNCVKSNKKCFDVENKIKKNVIPPKTINSELVNKLNTSQANSIIERLMKDYDNNIPLVLNDLTQPTTNQDSQKEASIGSTNNAPLKLPQYNNQHPSLMMQGRIPSNIPQVNRSTHLLHSKTSNQNIMMINNRNNINANDTEFINSELINIPNILAQGKFNYKIYLALIFVKNKKKISLPTVKNDL